MDPVEPPEQPFPVTVALTLKEEEGPVIVMFEVAVHPFASVAVTV